MSSKVKEIFLSNPGRRRWTIALGIAILALIFFNALQGGLIQQCVSYRQVDFLSDGRTISGVLVSSPQQQGQAPGIVIFHGVLAAKEWLSFYTQVLASHGFVVLAIDQAGHGATSGFRTGNALQVDGVAAVRFLSNQSSLVDPQRLGVLGWSMGGGTAFSVGQVLGPNDGLKSTVVVGMNVMNSSNSAGYPNFSSPPNLLMAIGRADELISFRQVLSDLAKITTNQTTLQSSTTYGNFSDFSARRLDTGSSDHVFESVDPDLIQSSLSWFQQSLNHSSTSSCLITPSSVGGRVFVQWAAGLAWLAVLFILLSYPRKDTTEYQLLEDQDIERTAKKTRGFWWLLHGLVWAVSVALGLIFSNINLSTLFLSLLLGAFLVATILFSLEYFLVARLDSNSRAHGFRAAIVDPWVKCETKAWKSMGLVAGIFILWWIVLEIILFNVPWQYGLAVPLIRSLKQLANFGWRRFVLFFGVWAWSFPTFVYDAAIIEHFTTRVRINDAAEKRGGLFTFLKILLQTVLSRNWLFALLMIIMLIITVAIPGGRPFGAFSFVALFVFPILEQFTYISILIVVMNVYGGYRAREVGLVSSALVAQLVASLLAFGNAN